MKSRSKARELTQSKNLALGKLATEISYHYPLMEIMGYKRMDKKT